MINFDKTEFDLGTIKHGEVKVVTALITNNTTNTVTFVPANSSCSCTTGSVENPDLLPNNSTNFNISFNTNKAGVGNNQVKSIALNYSIDRQQHSQIFRFKANVV